MRLTLRTLLVLCGTATVDVSGPGPALAQTLPEGGAMVYGHVTETDSYPYAMSSGSCNAIDRFPLIWFPPR